MTAPRACILGYPARFSRSPMIHGHWLAAHGIEGSYDRAEVAPEDLDTFLLAFTDHYRGCNVTAPHKEAVFARLDHAEPIAAALGAVNLVWVEDERLIGTNTDVRGFLGNLDEKASGWDRRLDRAVVIGAGGAARAAISGLLERGAGQVTIVNRTLERAEELVKLFGGRTRAAGWDALPKALGTADMLVNASSLGMAGKPPLDISLDPLPDHAVVSDLVYVPLETPLIAEARRQQLVAVDGLGMLLHQAVPAFERFFGVRPEVTPELRMLVEDDIRASRPA